MVLGASLCGLLESGRPARTCGIHHRLPAQIGALCRRLECLLNDQIGHVLNDPLEVLRCDGAVVKVRNRIKKVDRVRNSVPDSELDRIHVVPERPIECEAGIHDALAKLWAQSVVASHISIPMAPRWIVAGYQDIFLADDETA